MNKEDAGSAAAKGKGKRRWPIVVGVVAVVLVCAGIGFNAWHNQPSFCNVICHTPMDYYVDGYYAGAETGHASLAAAHEDAGVTCLQCHEATLEAQVNEGTAWISGAYSINADGSLQPQLITADKRQCTAAGCHEWQDVVAATENWGGQAGVNPHASHQGEAIDCSNCHSVHGESNMYCNACHSYEVPAGWASPASN